PGTSREIAKLGGNRIRPIHSLASVIGRCGFSPSVLATERLGFSAARCFYGVGSTGLYVSTGVVASAGWKTRIVTLDQSPWQTYRRRDAARAGRRLLRTTTLPGSRSPVRRLLR